MRRGGGGGGGSRVVGGGYKIDDHFYMHGNMNKGYKILL